MKGMILLADYFEDIEALVTIDLLRRARITIDLISLGDDLKVTSQSHVIIGCDYQASSIDMNEYDFLIIPGGKAVATTHLKSPETFRIVTHFLQKKQLVGCICAAPQILGRIGALKDKTYTCFPSCETEILDGKYLSVDVVVDGNIITGKAAGTTFEFAHAIIAYLKGNEPANEILAKVYYHI